MRRRSGVHKVTVRRHSLLHACLDVLRHEIADILDQADANNRRCDEGQDGEVGDAVRRRVGLV